MKQAIICDLDSTLCDLSHRLHLVQNPEKKKRNWNAFFAGIVHDKINKWCQAIVTNFADRGVAILYVTGRPITYLAQTADWLRRNGCPVNHIFMRPEKDYREDKIVKKELYDHLIKPEYDVLFCIDDRASVVKMWREQGLVCLHCAEGDFNV